MRREKGRKKSATKTPELGILSAGSSRELSLGLPSSRLSKDCEAKTDIPRPSFMRLQPVLCYGSFALK